MSKTLKAAIFMAASALACAGASAARAHIAIAPTMAAPGEAVVLSFIVGHGCEGRPTTALRVELPKAVTGIQPQPKAGWTPTVETLADGGRAVTWRGGEPLTKADSFAVRVGLPNQGERVAFVAVQSCGETTVRWDEPAPKDGPKPKHPAPVLTLANRPISFGDERAAPPVRLAHAGPAADLSSAPPGAERLPQSVQRQADGTLADAKGLALYTFNFDTMVGMSHCEDDCAKMWPPLAAPKSAKAFGDWTVIPRPDGSAQWAYKTKPLYTYSEDRAGQPARGLEAPNWSRAK
jgi:predicted lipoprotein with Yx(FWY)xxD motif/uncharacterized protein YcnI